MKKAYAVCSLCVSRAGSNTVFELLSLNIPTLLIPLPKAESRGDQLQNAEYFYNKGLVLRLFQEDIESDFMPSVLNLYNSRQNLKNAILKEKIPVANEKITQMLTRV